MMKALASGQLVTTGSPQPLSATPIKPKKWWYKADSDNTAAVYIGPSAQIDGSALSTTNGHKLNPGDDAEFDLTIQPGTLYEVGPADVYAVGSGGLITWLAFL